MYIYLWSINIEGHHCRYHMVVGFTIICAISAYHHQSCEFESRSWRDILSWYV